jgi:hypothetical protein
MFDGLIKKKLWRFGWKILAGIIGVIVLSLGYLYFITR